MSDVFDKTKALPFAWRLVRAGETIDLETPDEAPGRKRAPWEDDIADDGPPTPEQVEVRAEARAMCARIEVMVVHAWELRDPAAQAVATEKIARQAGKVDMQLCAMQAREGVRMARLFVRHYGMMSRAGRKGATDACFWVELGHVELGELIVEMVRSGNERIATAIGMSYDALESVEFDKGLLARRLAELLDAGASWGVRELAADWISAGEVGGVKPALRRALRLPHFGIRARAVLALEELTPPALDADDILFLLEDHVERRIPDDEGDAYDYAEVLSDAIVRLHPEGGVAPLLKIADPDHHHGWRAVIDRDWALGVLASAYPAHAMDAIDELAKSWRAYERRTAVDAALKLPWDDAKPRLLAFATDGAPSVAERARDGWLERTATRCTIPETAGLMIELLDAPISSLSPRLASRLIALRSGSLEARAALVDVLLREAPDREALVLIVFALADDALLRGGHGRRLPFDEARWGRRLVQAFGAPAVAGLCGLCERYPHPEIYGWFFVLRDLVKDGTIKRRDAAALRALSLRFLEADVSPHAALDILQKILPKNEARDLHLKIILESDTNWWFSSGALERIGRDPELDRRIDEALAQKLANSDYARVDTLLRIAHSRGRASAIEAAAELVARIEERPADPIDDEDLQTFREAARILDEVGRLGETWFEVALAKPESLRYRVALGVPRMRTKTWRRRLEQLLASNARGGAAAVEAAGTLLFSKPRLSRTDARIFDLAERAEPAARAHLLRDLCILDCPKSRLAPYVARLVATASEAEIEPLYDYLDRLSPKVLRRLIPAIKDDDVRAFVSSLVAPLNDATEWVDDSG